MPTSIYRLANGKRVPGTTTILSRWKESGALIAWSYKRGYEDAEAGKPPNQREIVEESGGIGTYTHALVEWHLSGQVGLEPDPAQCIPVQYLTADNIARGYNGYTEFLSWQDQTGLVVIPHERPMVSERYAYGGTPDGLGERGGRLSLMDWKTSKRLYADYLLQLAGYWILHEENYPDRPIKDGVHIVRFSKQYGDFTHAHFDQLDREKRQFLRLVEAYEDDKIIKQRV